MHKIYSSLKGFKLKTFYTFGFNSVVFDFNVTANAAPYWINGDCELPFLGSKTSYGNGSLPVMTARFSDTYQHGDIDYVLEFNSDFLFFNMEPDWENN